MDRSPSVQSFASADSMSMPATSSPGSPIISSTNITMHEADKPRVATLKHDGSDAPMHVGQDAPDSPQAHRFYFKDGTIKFKLDNGTLYNVHRYFFETHAPKFAYEYLHNDGNAPIKLPGVSSVDLERFLTIIYPTKLGKCDITAVEEWTSVLRLATKWSIESLRDLAVEEIGPKASPFDKVAVAREFKLGPDWLVPAFVDICSRSEPLTRAEAERLGLPTVVEISRIRENAKASGTTLAVPVAVLANEVLVPHVPDNAQRAIHMQERTLSGSVDADLAADASRTSHTEASSAPAPASASSSEASLDVSPQHSLISQISKRLAHQTLQSAEIAEEAKYTGTALNRALFALNLARRMSRETSVAAQRHRAWRQARVDSILSELGSDGYLPSAVSDEISGVASDSLGTTSIAFQQIRGHLARLVCAQLRDTASEAAYQDSSRPRRKIHFLFVRLGAEHIDKRQELKTTLRRYGWKVEDVDDYDLQVPIPDKACNNEDVPKYTP